MLKRNFTFILFVFFFLTPFASLAQEGVKVVPIGQTIKPEGASTTTKTTKKKRRRPSYSVVKPGTSFLVETMTALSSGITKQGDVVYIRAVEDVGPSRRPAVVMGAIGRGTVTEIKGDSKKGKIVVSFENIENVAGEPVDISGGIEITGKKSQAQAAVGERFTATLDEKVIAKRPPRQRKKKGSEPEILNAFVEISGKGVKADLKKGSVKGKIQAILEAPKGYTADDIDVSTVVLSKVNDFSIPHPSYATAGKPKQGDANKNGTSDWSFYFKAWDFIKNQPKGQNTVNISGMLKDGRSFEAQTRVTVDY